MFRKHALLLVAAAMIGMPTVSVADETCYMAKEMQPATRQAIEAAAQRYAQQLISGDASGLQGNATQALSQDFISTTVNDNRANLAGAQATIENSFQLSATGAGPTDAQFICGVWKTPSYVEFRIPQLAPGEYAVVLMEAAGGKQPYNLSFVLQQQGGVWKLAGIFPKPATVAGMTGNDYLQKARQYSSAGQNDLAYLYYQLAVNQLVPVPFMYDDAIGKMYQEQASVKPSKLPWGNNTVNFSANGKTYTLSEAFPVVNEGKLFLVLRHKVPSLGDSGKLATENLALIKAFVTQNPEFRTAFAGIVARAVEPGGKDYGTLLAMKDVK